MKRIIALILAVLCIFSLAACGKTAEESTSAETVVDEKEVASAKEWIEKKIDENDFFSFDYDGASFKDFIGTWEKNVENGTDENGNDTYTVTYSNDGVNAVASVIVYSDSPSIDWVINFENTGSSDCKPISNIQALNTQYEITDATVQYAYGGNSDGHDFEPLYCDLAEESSLTFSSSGGRSSNAYMPYYDLYNDEGGIVVAIGWTGQWTASFDKNDTGINLAAGMSETDIALHANESMRTPSIVITFFEGDHEEGQNIFRRLVLNNYYPEDETGEKITELPLTLNLWGSSGEATLLAQMQAADNTDWPYEVMWVDAGWHGENASVDTYDTAWYYEAGNWYVNDEIYPNGLTTVTDALHAEGKKFLLWFEPERVVEGSDIDVNHPEYVLKGSSTTTFELYNLASDEATDYLIDLIGGLIKDNGVDWYRQDFNCEPLTVWQYNDSQEGAHRTGITEIKYITNLYRYLDGLIEMNPGLLIDNCASGGRRLDIEMSKRSVPMWRSDYYVSGSDVETNTEAARNIAWNLSYWVPMSCGGNTSDGLDDSYEFRCQMGSGLTMSVQNATNKEFWAEKMDEYFTCREMMNGDYYILGEGTGASYNSVNAAYEYFVPEEGRGFIMAFRPYNSIEAATSYKLWGLDADATYTLTVTDNDEVFELDGKTLMEQGLNINLENAKSSVLIYIDEK